MILPMQMRRFNAIDGSAIAAHYAFFTQRDHLDRTDLLQHYAALAPPIDLPPSIPA